MTILKTNKLAGPGGTNAIDGSLFFSDTNDRLSVPNSADVRVGSGDFTIEAWIRAENPGDWTTIIGMWDSSATRRTYVLQRKKSDSKLYFYVSADGGSTISATATQVASGGDVTLGDWHHVAGVRDGNTIRAYLNGVEVGNASFTASILNNTTDALFIGDTEVTAGGEAFNGYMSNVRMVKGTCLYPSGTTFTPPTSKLTAVDGTVLLCCQDSDDPTQEATGKTITGYGNLASVGANDNLVTNGHFTTGTTGWDDSLAPSETTLSSENQRLKIVASGGTGRARQVITGLTIGNRYKFQVRHVTCASGNCFTHLGTSDGGSEVAQNLGLGDEDLHTVYFNATTTTLYIQIGITIGLTGYFDDVSLTLAEQPKAPKVLPPVGTDSGTVLEGGVTFDSLNYMTLPKGTTTQRGRGRGVFGGGYTSSPSGAAVKRIYYIQIDSMGTSAEFGDTNKAAAWGQGGCSSSTRGLFTGGTNPTNLNDIDYITIATTSNGLDFGDLDVQHGYTASCSNNTRGLTGGGRGGSPTARLAQIDYNTIATLGNGQDFGDLTQSRMGLGAVASSTRGVFTGGNGSPADPSTVYNNIDYVEIATTGDATDFGDMTDEHTYHGSCSSSTRGIIYGGVTSYGPTVTTNIIEYITIASTGNGTDFGDVRDDGEHAHGTSNSIRGVFAGGVNPYRNSIDFITITTTGNGVDWGDLPIASGSYAYAAGLSDSHGGLSE